MRADWPAPTCPEVGGERDAICLTGSGMLWAAGNRLKGIPLNYFSRCISYIFWHDMMATRRPPGTSAKIQSFSTCFSGSLNRWDMSKRVPVSDKIRTSHSMAWFSFGLSDWTAAYVVIPPTSIGPLRHCMWYPIGHLKTCHKVKVWHLNETLNDYTVISLKVFFKTP